MDALIPNPALLTIIESKKFVMILTLALIQTLRMARVTNGRRSGASVMGAPGGANKYADKWAKDGPNVWHERWGEDYDGTGGCVKYTDKVGGNLSYATEDQGASDAQCSSDDEDVRMTWYAPPPTRKPLPWSDLASALLFRNASET